MTYFELSRRLARPHDAILGLLAFFAPLCTVDHGCTGPPSIAPGIVIPPCSTSVGINQTVRFGAVSTISCIRNVTWSATDTTVDASGKYTASKVIEKYRPIAGTLNGVAGTAVVTILAPVRIGVSPASIELQTGTTKEFNASGKMSDTAASTIAVTWSASGGTISSTGLYTASQSAGHYKVIAALAGGTLADTSAIAIAGSPPPPVAPPPPPVPPTAAVPILPGQSIQTAVDANPAGTAFLLKKGLHVRQSVLAKNRDTFLCEPGTILTGQDVTPHAFRMVGGNPDSVTIRGCIIEHYAPPIQMGAIEAGWATPGEGTTGWIVDATEVRYNANAGIRLGHAMQVLRSNVHHNGTIGITGIGDDVLIENDTVAFNNYAGAGVLGFETGGTKFVLTNRLTLRNNYVHDNRGPGLWLDIGNDQSLIEGNRVEDNLQEGIVSEISYSSVIRNNQVRRNGLGDARRTSWPWGAGIGIHASGGSGIDVYGNVVEGNAHGIVLLQQNRGSGRLGAYLVQNVSVHDNTVTQVNTGSSGAVQDTGDTGIFTSRNNRFTGNTYVVTGNPHPFVWQNRWSTAAEWKFFGQE